MRVAVTGATGTIGRAVVRALRHRGDEVVALSRSAASARERFGEGVEVQEGHDRATGGRAADGLAWLGGGHRLVDCASVTEAVSCCASDTEAGG